VRAHGGRRRRGARWAGPGRRPGVGGGRPVLAGAGADRPGPPADRARPRRRRPHRHPHLVGGPPHRPLARQGRPPPPPLRMPGPRRAAAVLLLVLGGLAVVLADVAVWARAFVLDRDSFVTALPPLARGAEGRDGRGVR